ncbi:MAG TPA: L-histidine N(alpha)-methyltransferase [Polyangia bacterium]|nr:L-histidine N(alpha)-methyltransferase [Polyangia bacterium]
MSGSLVTAQPRLLGRPRREIPVGTTDAVAEAVRRGLLHARRKQLPPWLLYDEEGSALFEDITRLPEYYLTRTEREILTRNADAILDAAGPPLEVVELGAGSASKTRLLLEALLLRQPRVRYVPVDVSRAAHAQARAQLRGLPRLEVRPVAGRYPEELGFLRLRMDDGGVRRLILFMGSNIGNLDLPSAHRLLVAVRRCLAPGDSLLIGADRRKSPRLLVPAYDDSAGVTARFSLNLLVRLNRELGATFDPARFRHVVRWNARRSRIEIFLESSRAQRIAVPALGAEIDFAAGERIHLESSYKLTAAAMNRLLARAGFETQEAWTDVRRWFGVTLARPVR